METGSALIGIVQSFPILFHFTLENYPISSNCDPKLTPYLTMASFSYQTHASYSRFSAKTRSIMSTSKQLLHSLKILTNTLEDREERAVASLLTRFKNLVSLAASPVEDGATKEVAAAQTFQMEIESTALVSSRWLKDHIKF
jgi:hypothetical protein